MRADLPGFSVVRPASLDEAFEILAGVPSIRPIAGGTDLMVQLNMGSVPPGTWLDLTAIPELDRPHVLDGGLEIGPLTTYTHIRRDAAAGSRYPLLPRAAREVGALAIQSRGTWVGNVANASPAADGVPALMAYDAVVELGRGAGRRRVPLCDFYSGYKAMDMDPTELITAIHLPEAPPGRYEYFRKVGTRRFQAISKVVVAGWLTLDGRRIEDVRLVYGSVAPFTLRLRATEDILRGSRLDPSLIAPAADRLDGEISPIDDIRSTAEYRRLIARNLLVDFLTRVGALAGQPLA